MKWWWSRRRTEPDQLAQEPQPQDDHPLDQIDDDTDLRKQYIVASNVMDVRDAVHIFLAIIESHREDGHDCPPSCIPSQLDYFLRGMGRNDLCMMLTVMLKDTIEDYLQQQHEGSEGGGG